jgi:hypothetical protein
MIASGPGRPSGVSHSDAQPEALSHGGPSTTARLPVQAPGQAASGWRPGTANPATAALRVRPGTPAHRGGAGNRDSNFRAAVTTVTVAA